MLITKRPPERANDEDQKEIATWTNRDETKMHSIIRHKIEKKMVVFLVEYALEDDESDASSLKGLIEQDGGLWTPARALMKDAPVLMGRYIVKHNLQYDGAQTWKKLWDALKKKNSREKSNKGTPPRKIPKTVTVVVSPKKTCDHCKDWQHYRSEENAEFFGIRGDLQGAKCLDCNGDMYKDEKCRPTSKNPGHACSGRESDQCMSCYCGGCYKNKLLSDSNSRSSRNKRRKLAIDV